MQLQLIHQPSKVCSFSLSRIGYRARSGFAWFFFDWQDTMSCPWRLVYANLKRLIFIKKLLFNCIGRHNGHKYKESSIEASVNIYLMIYVFVLQRRSFLSTENKKAKLVLIRCHTKVKRELWNCNLTRISHFHGANRENTNVEPSNLKLNIPLTFIIILQLHYYWPLILDLLANQASNCECCQIMTYN